MAALTNDQELERIEELAREAEISLEVDDSRRDLKENRGIIKQTLYGGSQKLKHIVPKGKRV